MSKAMERAARAIAATQGDHCTDDDLRAYLPEARAAILAFLDANDEELVAALAHESVYPTAGAIRALRALAEGKEEQ